MADTPSPPDTDAAIAHVLAHGYYIMEDAFDADFCDDILAEIHDLEARDAPLSLRNDFHGHRTARYFDLLNHGEVWQRIPVHPAILPVVRGVLGDDCLLNTYGTAIIGPGEKAQQIHVDDGPFISAHNSALRNRPRLVAGGPRSPIVINTMIALTDFTEETGATRYVPDSPRLPYPREEDADKWMAESKAAVMSKGSIFFFEGQCFHSGGANTTTNERRYGVTVDYCAGYLRTQENFLLTLPHDRVSQFDRELRKLVGLWLSEGGLGHVYQHHPEGIMSAVAMKSVRASDVTGAGRTKAPEP
jgi:ectoine hydroxylase-related dioxygenase (phytanoyl-CoA dioxygenase family)